MKRRTFLQGAALGGAAVGIGFDMSKARAEMRQFKIARTTETRSTCPYCAVSCGVIIHTLGDKAKNVTPSVVHVEGDPDHPTSCSGSSSARWGYRTGTARPGFDTVPRWPVWPPPSAAGR